MFHVTKVSCSGALVVSRPDLSAELRLTPASLALLSTGLLLPGSLRGLLSLELLALCSKVTVQQIPTVFLTRDSYYS